MNTCSILAVLSLAALAPVASAQPSTSSPTAVAPATAVTAALPDAKVAAPSPMTPAPPGPSGYHLLKAITLGGEGGWDYLAVDAVNRRVYVSHSTRVEVLDADRLEKTGEITDLSGVHGIAIANELGRGFISNGKTSTITIFDLKTLKKLDEVKSTGEGPDAILFDPFSKRVFAFNGHTGNATAIDAATGKVVGSIELGGKPEFATSDLKGSVFVNIEDKSEIVTFDPKTLKVKSRHPLKPCEEPSGMAIDRASHRVLIGCSNQLAAVVDTDTGKLVETVAIGDGVDANAYDPSTKLGFSANGDGTLTVIHETAGGHYGVLETVATRRGARTMTLDETTHHLFLTTAQFGPPPAPTEDHPHPRPSILPDSFVVLVFGK
ncbi:MAG: YncE family protein [Acidobacteriota bacterium]